MSYFMLCDVEIDWWIVGLVILIDSAVSRNQFAVLRLIYKMRKSFFKLFGADSCRFNIPDTDTFV